MAAVGGGVDERRAPSVPHSDVAVPQVAVQAGRRLLGHQLRRAGRRPPRPPRRRRARARRGRRPAGRTGSSRRSAWNSAQVSAGRCGSGSRAMKPSRSAPYDGAPAAWVAARLRPSAAGVVAAGPARLDPARAPGSRRSTASTSGTATPPSAVASASQRRPRASLSKKPGGGLVERLHQRRGAVAQAQLGGDRDVTAGDRCGRDDGRAEQLLGAAGQAAGAGHRVERPEDRVRGRRPARRSSARPWPAPPGSRRRPP